MCTKSCDPGCGCSNVKKFDPTKPVQTRAGLPARIVCTDYKGYQKNTPILALVQTSPGVESTQVYKEDGTCSVHSVDLVNVPEREIRYVNIYGPNGSVGAIGQKLSNFRHSNLAADGGPPCTIKLTFEDGKLIDSEVIR